MGKHGYHVIDADGHVAESGTRVLPYVDQPFRDRLEHLIEWRKQNTGAGHMSPVDIPYNDLAQGYERTGRRLLGTSDVGDNLTASFQIFGTKTGFHREMRDGAGNDPTVTREDLTELGIDQAVWFPTQLTSIVALREPEYEAAVARGYNRWVGEFCAAQPGQFFAVAIVPHCDPELAAVEIDRVGKEDWCVGVTSCLTMPDKLPDHPYFDPIYRACEEHDLALCVHSGTDRPPYAPARSELSDNYFLLHMTGHPWQQMRAMAAIIGGGIYERYPTLRFAHLESGCGWVPYWMERMDSHAEKLAYTVPYLKAKPSEHVTGGRCFVSFEADEVLLPAFASVIGEDHLVYASDYPHYDANLDAVPELVARTDLTDAQKRKFLGDNARRLFTRLG
jgi:uncharacterized protein